MNDAAAITNLKLHSDKFIQSKQLTLLTTHLLKNYQPLFYLRLI